MNVKESYHILRAKCKCFIKPDKNSTKSIWRHSLLCWILAQACWPPELVFQLCFHNWENGGQDNPRGYPCVSMFPTWRCMNYQLSIPVFCMPRYFQCKKFPSADHFFADSSDWSPDFQWLVWSAIIGQNCAKVQRK